MKKKIIFVLLFIIMFLSGCSQAYDNYYDSVSYQYLTKFEYEDKVYEVMIPVNTNDSIVHYYKIGKNTSKSKEWTINYSYTYDYFLFDYANSELIDTLSQVMIDSSNLLANRLGYTPNIKANNSTEIIEKTLTNPTSEEAQYVIVKEYLPIILEQDYNSYLISVPINVYALLKINDYVEDPRGEKNIAWDNFLTIPNMIEEE